MNGLLQNPSFNMGVGLLSARGMPQGLLTGMNQYNQNMQQAQAVQYQQAIIEQMKEKARREAEQEAQRQRAALSLSMQEGAGPVQPGMQSPQEVNQSMYDMLIGTPGLMQAYGAAQLPQPQKLTDDMREYQYALQNGYKGSFTDWMDKVKKAPQTNVSVVNDKFEGQLGTEMAKNVIAQYDKMSGMRDSLTRMNEAEALLDSGILTGPLANFKVGFGKLLQEAGVNLGANEIANTEAFAAFMGNETAQIIKEFGAGTGLSDADRDYAEKIAGGKITLSEESIRKLFKIRRKYTKKALETYNEKAKQVSSKYGNQLAYPITIDLPEGYKKAAPQEDQIDSLMKKYGQ